MDIRTGRAALGILGTVVLALGTPSAAQVTLEGEVLDALSRHPVEGAMIILASADRVVFSDDHGYFALANLPLGVTQLKVIRIGYGSITGVAVNIEAGRLLEILLQPEAVAIEGLTAEVRSSESRLRRESGNPVDLISRDDIETVEGRMGSVLDVIRAKGPPRLRISATPGGSSSGALVRYCIESTRGSSSPSDLGGRIGGCRPALLSLDGAILFEPTSVRAAGKDLAATLSSQASELILTMPPEAVQSVRWMSPSEARFRFGEAGKFGALIIRTRSGGGGAAGSWEVGGPRLGTQQQLFRRRMGGPARALNTAGRDPDGRVVSFQVSGRAWVQAWRPA